MSRGYCICIALTVPTLRFLITVDRQNALGWESLMVVPVNVDEVRAFD
jgi:hypothetical protein